MSMRVISQVRKLHSNATWIILNILGAWFEGLIGLILIFPYKFGFLTLGDPSRIFYGFESDESLSLNFSWESVPLVIGSLLIWHYLGLLNGGIICFVIERSIATVLSRDYELKQRKWLSMSLHISHHIIAIVMCLFFCFHVLPLSILLLLNALGFVFEVPYIFFLRYYNRKVRNEMRLAENITHHSLTAKFQTEENLRSMNIAARLSLIVGMFDALFLIVIVLAMCKVPGAEVFSQAAEFVLFLNPIFLIPGIMSSVEEWRNSFKDFLHIIKPRIDPNHNPYVVSDYKETSEMHFLQLETYWI